MKPTEIEWIDELTAVVTVNGKLWVGEFSCSLEADNFEKEEPEIDDQGFGFYLNGDPFVLFPYECYNFNWDM